MTKHAPGLRSSSVRQQNLTTVVRLLHLDGPMSRSHIGQRTGLTRTAVATLVGDLVELGLTTELDPDPSGARGRPSPVVHPLGDRNVVIGIDLMVDSLGVAVVGLGGATLRSVRRDRSRGPQSPEASVAEAAKIVDRMKADLPHDVRHFGIGVAVPGLIAQPSQEVVLAPNLNWRNIDLLSILHDTFGDGTLITIGNEADLGAVAESRRGSVTDYSNILFLSGEVGVGGGLIANGMLLTGTNGFAGEIGHMPLNPNGTRCGCGAIGCFETELGEVALLRRAGIDGAGRFAIDELLQRAEAGDPAVLQALQEHARWLALGLSGPLNLLDLDTVVVGGLLGRVFPYMEQALAAEFADRVQLSPRATPVVASALGEEAAGLGAAEQTWDEVLSDVELHARRFVTTD